MVLYMQLHLDCLPLKLGFWSKHYEASLDWNIAEGTESLTPIGLLLQAIHILNYVNWFINDIK